MQDFPEVLADDNIVGGGGDGNPLRNGPMKSHKKFQLSKLRIVDKRSKKGKSVTWKRKVIETKFVSWLRNWLHSKTSTHTHIHTHIVPL